MINGGENVIQAIGIAMNQIKDFIEMIANYYKQLIAASNEFSRVFATYGPFAWLFLAYVESIFPFLMLSLITLLNIKAASYAFGDFWGWIIGFLLSYVGTTLGAITMFTFWRYISDKIRYFRNKRLKRTNSKDNIHTSHKGIVGLLTISSIPLLPSSLITFTYAFSKMKTKVFIIVTTIGKFFMMLFMSIFAGFFDYLFSDIFRALISVGVIIIISLILNMNEERIINFTKNHLNKIPFIRNMEERYKDGE